MAQAPLSSFRKDLWTPDGNVPIDGHDVRPLLPIEVHALSVLDAFNNKNNKQLSYVCRRCDSAVVGKNNGSSSVYTMACRCTEWRFTR